MPSKLKFPKLPSAKKKSLKLGNEPTELRFKPIHKIKFAQPKMPVFHGLK